MQAKLGVGIAATAFLVLSVSAFAHHGGAAYDMSNPLTVKGTVTEFQFINPHSLVFFDVKNDKGEIDESTCVIEPKEKLFVFGDKGEKLPKTALKDINKLYEMFGEKNLKVYEVKK